MQKKSSLVLIVLIFMFSLTLVSAFGYDTDDIVNSPFGYDTEDYPTPIFEHSHLYTHTDITMIVSGVGEWMNVTFDTHKSEIQDRVTHNWTDSTNDTFTIQDTGEYRLDANLVLTDSAAIPDSDIDYRFIRNNIEIYGSARPVDIDRQDDDRVSDTFAVANLIAGDEIKLQFASDSATSGLGSDCQYADHCTSAVISIKRTG